MFKPPLKHPLSPPGNQALLPGQASTGKERAPTRRSGAKGSGTDVVSYKGSMVNISSLLQTLEKGTAVQRALEQRVCTLQTKLGNYTLSVSTLVVSKLPFSNSSSCVCVCV